MNEKYRKIPVFGMKFRDGESRMVVLDKVTSRALTKAIVSNVKLGSTVYSDAYSGYKHLSSIGYDHKVTNHKTCFARGDTHTTRELF